jgi:hypothetical protein
MKHPIVIPTVRSKHEQPARIDSELLAAESPRRPDPIRVARIEAELAAAQLDAGTLLQDRVQATLRHWVAAEGRLSLGEAMRETDLPPRNRPQLMDAAKVLLAHLDGA